MIKSQAKRSCIELREKNLFHFHQRNEGFQLVRNDQFSNVFVNNLSCIDGFTIPIRCSINQINQIDIEQYIMTYNISMHVSGI